MSTRTLCIKGADEELVDQKKYLEESCQPKCVKPLIEYQACVKRVEGDNNGEKHCTGQYFDYISCVDKCVAPKLFGALKYLENGAMKVMAKAKERKMMQVMAKVKERKKMEGYDAGEALSLDSMAGLVQWFMMSFRRAHIQQPLEV
ncbi:cytochrome b-c1 complex subunit 6-like [Prunus yedoensis var. nudiflora]|uniref:Complex III subunit VI n=1 Tax=Prunus yedoensis var. nudiflora TaxID=2094558 RepID=A0A314XSR3_PRUYE|nr:cytochrome b-c1 complex subunit 6-like [Prunus yedoensis var. nudiflora]